MKKCPKCEEIKPIEEFTLDSTCKSGRKSWCKKCCSVKSLEYYHNNQERMCKNGIKWRSEHRERHHFLTKKWAQEHPDEVLAKRKRAGKKLRSTFSGRLKENIRTSIVMSLRRGTKAKRKWEGIVGFTLDQLRSHLEKKFKIGMTWDNYGMYWHIDHIIPIAAFNFECPDDIDFKRCWSLKNLQPLEAKVNIAKKDKVEFPFQPCLAMNVSSVRQNAPQQGM
jgi:hypothetical protein